MSNIVADSRIPEPSNYACFSHLFGSRVAKVSWITLFLTDNHNSGALYIDDFAKSVIPEEVWQHITMKENDQGYWRSYTFDTKKLDSDSLFFALTVMRYPQEFGSLATLYLTLRDKCENKNLCFILAHVLRATLDNFNHTLTHYSLFINQKDEDLLNFDFRKRWPMLDPTRPHSDNPTRKLRIFNVLQLSGRDPYTFWSPKGSEEQTALTALTQQLKRLMGINNDN